MSNYQQQPAMAPQGGGTDGTAIAGVVLSVIGLLACAPLAIVGLILGYSSRNKAQATPGASTGAATAAIVIGWIAIVLWVIGSVFWFTIIND